MKIILFLKEFHNLNTLKCQVNNYSPTIETYQEQII